MPQLPVAAVVMNMLARMLICPAGFQPLRNLKNTSHKRGSGGNDQASDATNVGNMVRTSSAFKNPNEAASIPSIPSESDGRSFAWQRKRKKSKSKLL